jgi:hypothetical protein
MYEHVIILGSGAGCLPKKDETMAAYLDRVQAKVDAIMRAANKERGSYYNYYKSVAAPYQRILDWGRPNN